MSTEEQHQSEERRTVDSQDAQMQDANSTTDPEATASANRKRPRLDLAVDSRDRKRGKTMFGLVLGTLNKAKNEDKERNASEAAKKRQLIEQRLQDKLRKETDSVRRAEEAKKDKTVANRKEEELQLKDSIYKQRRVRLPLLANFLSTADNIPSEDSTDSSPAVNPLAPLPRSHPPPLYYLPAKLTQAQEAFLKRRKEEVEVTVESEWSAFVEERRTGIEEITTLRKRVAEEEERKKSERRDSDADPEQDMKMADAESTAAEVPPKTQSTKEEGTGKKPALEADATMEVDEEGSASQTKSSSTPASVPAPVAVPKPVPSAPSMPDEDDAVEY